MRLQGSFAAAAVVHCAMCCPTHQPGWGPCTRAPLPADYANQTGCPSESATLTQGPCACLSAHLGCLNQPPGLFVARRASHTALDDAPAHHLLPHAGGRGWGRHAVPRLHLQDAPNEVPPGAADVARHLLAIPEEQKRWHLVNLVIQEDPAAIGAVVSQKPSGSDKELHRGGVM